MDSRPEIAEMATPVGSLELPEGLLQALTGSRGEEGTTRVTDLPSVVVGSILSRLLNPVDIASAFKASRLFWSAARSTPFRLRLRPSRGFVGNGDDPGLPPRTNDDPQKLVAWTRAALTGIRNVMRSTQELDLAGCPIRDDDVAAVLVDLRCLDALVLDGCRKLTSSVALALAVSVRSGPRVLSLQRCFGLGPAAAGNLLAAAAAHGSRLQVILLSHLDRLDFPREPPVLEPIGDGNCKEGGNSLEVLKSVGSPSSGAGLRILALHNCGGLGYSELVAISETCPFVEVLMLGGSVDGLGLSRPETLSQEKVVTAASALVGAAELLPRLRIFEITFFTAPILRAVREQVSKNIFVWDFCDKNSVATAAAVVASLKSRAQSSGGEDSFLGSPEDLPNTFSRFSSDTEICVSQKGDRDVEGVHVGEPFLSRSSATQGQYPHQGLDERWDCIAEDVLMALRAGTNCSDVRRRTPLHVAAALGESGVVANLLSIGASARGMKDSAGATALFVAAESGHAQVCDHLLRGGADVLVSNRTGETPLYIAALRGHSAAVEVILGYCQEHGVNWQDADVYGDGWTPLMAATVADRQDVGKVLLWAARTTSTAVSLEGGTYRDFKTNCEPEIQVGAKDVVSQSDNSSSVSSISSTEDVFGPQFTASSRSASQLLNAQNRYGQTALHIAARRGSMWFVSNLLQAGASLAIQDEYGLRAVDVARKQHHSIVEKLLKHWAEEQKDANDSRRGSTSKKQPKTRKKVAASANKPSSGGNLFSHSSSSNRSLSWVPKSSSAVRSAVGDVTPDTGSHTESSNSVLESELLSVPDSPTSIVPSWMHSSPPVSPHLQQLPAVLVERGEVDDVDAVVSVEDIQELLGSEASQTHDRVEGQHYWRGRGIRRRTASGDSNTSISSEDRQL